MEHGAVNMILSEEQMSAAKKRTYIIRAWQILAVLAVIAVIAGVIWLIIQSKPMISSLKQLPFTTDENYCCTGTGFLYLRGRTVYYYDIDDPGEENYTGNSPANDIMLSGAGRDMHVLYDTKTLYIVGNKDAVNINGEIKSVKCANGYAACLIERSGRELIEVYSKTGELAMEINTDAPITDYGFADMQSSKLYTVSCELAAERCVSTVITYDPSIPATTGIITVQDELIEKMVFSDKSIFIKTTKKLIRYDADTNKESYSLIANGFEMKDQSITGGSCITVMKSTSENDLSTKLYRIASGDVPSVKLTQLPTGNTEISTVVCGKNVYIIYEGKVLRYDERGNLKESKKIKCSVTDVVKLSENRLLIVSGSTLYITDINADKK